MSIFIAGSAITADRICHEYCEDVGFCVTVTETRYIYRGCPVNDDGVIIGMINYPRFPLTHKQMWERVEALAERLRIEMKQDSYSIQAPDKTVWISHRDAA